MTRQDIIYEIKDYFYITLGLLLYTFGFTVFLLPYEIVTGGIAGIGAIVFYSTGFPVQYTFFIINAVLIILALKTLGWKFLTKTIYATIMLTIMLEVAQTFTIQADGTFHKLLGENNDFMSLVIGCTITGTALATVFLNNGSTGGTDIVAAVLNKFHNISLGKALIIVDFCIIGSCIFVDSFGTVDLRFRKVVFGLCTMLIECLMLDYVMYWQRQSVQFLIFSKKYQEIAYAISRTTDHTLTILDGHGFWTGKPTKVLCLLAKKRESVHIFRLIKQIDPNAFVSQSSVIGVYGEGFDEMKVKIKPSNKEIITTVNNENNISNKQRA